MSKYIYVILLNIIAMANVFASNQDSPARQRLLSAVRAEIMPCPFAGVNFGLENHVASVLRDIEANSVSVHLAVLEMHELGNSYRKEQDSKIVAEFKSCADNLANCLEFINPDLGAACIRGYLSAPFRLISFHDNGTLMGARPLVDQVISSYEREFVSLLASACNEALRCGRGSTITLIFKNVNRLADRGAFVEGCYGIKGDLLYYVEDKFIHTALSTPEGCLRMTDLLGQDDFLLSKSALERALLLACRVQDCDRLVARMLRSYCSQGFCAADPEKKFAKEVLRLFREKEQGQEKSKLRGIAAHLSKTQNCMFRP